MPWKSRGGKRPLSSEKKYLRWINSFRKWKKAFMKTARCAHTPLHLAARSRSRWPARRQGVRWHERDRGGYEACRHRSIRVRGWRRGSSITSPRPLTGPNPLLSLLCLTSCHLPGAKRTFEFRLRVGGAFAFVASPAPSFLSRTRRAGLTQLYFERQRALAEAALLPEGDPSADTLSLRPQELAAHLDGWSGGWRSEQS
jgi:hypothetical protein